MLRQGADVSRSAPTCGRTSACSRGRHGRLLGRDESWPTGTAATTRRPARPPDDLTQRAPALVAAQPAPGALPPVRDLGPAMTGAPAGRLHRREPARSRCPAARADVRGGSGGGSSYGGSSGGSSYGNSGGGSSYGGTGENQLPLQPARPRPSSAGPARPSSARPSAAPTQPWPAVHLLARAVIAAAPAADAAVRPQQSGPYTGPQQASPVPAQQQNAPTLAEAVKAAHQEGQDFGESVARDAPALWLEAVLARKPRMPSDLEARLLQGSSLPIDFLLHDEVRHALRRGFWDALERSRR